MDLVENLAYRDVIYDNNDNDTVAETCSTSIAISSEDTLLKRRDRDVIRSADGLDIKSYWPQVGSSCVERFAGQW